MDKSVTGCKTCPMVEHDDEGDPSRCQFTGELLPVAYIAAPRWCPLRTEPLTLKLADAGGRKR